MTDDKHIALLKKLIVSTQSGKLEWEEAPFENGYQASFPTATVLASDLGPYFNLRIKDSRGETIDSLSSAEFKLAQNLFNTESFEILGSNPISRLYEIIRRKVLKVCAFKFDQISRF